MPGFADGPATYVDDSHISCITPDFSALFAPALSGAAFQEAYVQVSEYDGTFRKASELRFRFYLRPEITALEPTEGYASRAVQVTLVGKNF